MGKKKKRVEKVFCYYCDREFDDEKILVQHQKAKHFKCHVCHKKLSTAGGMAIHVLQVHKESVTKCVPSLLLLLLAVDPRRRLLAGAAQIRGYPTLDWIRDCVRVPNAKPERDSTEIEIFGMQGIPSDVLAAHYGEVPVYLKYACPIVLLAHFLEQLLISVSLFHRYNPAMMVRPPIWPLQQPQPWFAQQPPVSVPPMMAGQAPQQPLFPIQNMPNPMMTSAPANLLQTSYAMPTTGVPSPVAPQASQPLFPVNTTGNGAANSSFSSSISPATIAANSPASVGTAGYGYVANNPGTGGPAIGQPPAAATNSKTSATQPATSEVYLVWDDEAMSMEERRLALPMYQVHDETSQLSLKNHWSVAPVEQVIRALKERNTC
uniref:Zinc finger protein 207 n=1 Tax=Aegilops tauschii TaxID=37682 RepID=M8C4X8_AEGTA